ncbi:RNA-binding signal recognition particle subunit SRP14 [Sporobolomyces salmoneus]|uniref:RNA-binding signal recognition particle subunit SRP14 n=1 Tax=Sporobolomyces salmoneus TaxID=183962 RepID=UPI00316CD026
MHLSNEVFLERLSELFDSRKDVGSVFLTTKRLTYEPATELPQGEGEDTAMKGESDHPPTASTSTSQAEGEKEYPLLVRATDGKGKKDIKTKLSTIVQPQDYSAFIERYTTILRTSLSASLRPKRKRTGATKTKSKSSSSSKSASNPSSSNTTAASTTAESGFRPKLPKVVGPRRGNGRKKRQASQARREKLVNKIRKSREERARRQGQTV